MACDHFKPVILPLSELLDRRVLDRYPVLAEFGESMGQTPLVAVPGPAGGGRVFAKCEWLNPTGTVKDRTAFGFVYDIVKDLDPQEVCNVHLLECTGGNLAFALNRLCAPLGITCTFVSVEGYLADQEIDALQQDGHEILFVSKTLGFEGCLNRGGELAAQHPDWIFLHQHENRANLEVHRRFTGGEMVRQLAAMDRVPSAWAASVGTAGCLMGVYEALRRPFPEVGLYVVSPAEKPYGGQLPYAPDVPSYSGAGGYTCGRKQPFVERDEDQVTGRIEISFEEAMLHVATFERATGVVIGGSSSANWLAAYRIARELGPEGVVCTMFPSASHTAIERQRIERFSDLEVVRGLAELDLRSDDYPDLGRAHQASRL
ncbi:MAG: pyridoxal-phosphate dependent enzyme [Acidobacteriota bacterium]